VKTAASARPVPSWRELVKAENGEDTAPGTGDHTPHRAMPLSQAPRGPTLDLKADVDVPVSATQPRAAAEPTRAQHHAEDRGSVDDGGPADLYHTLRQTIAAEHKPGRDKRAAQDDDEHIRPAALHQPESPDDKAAPEDAGGIAQHAPDDDAQAQQTRADDPQDQPAPAPDAHKPGEHAQSQADRDKAGDPVTAGAPPGTSSLLARLKRIPESRSG
jgi:hypothetical protein